MIVTLFVGDVPPANFAATARSPEPEANTTEPSTVVEPKSVSVPLVVEIFAPTSMPLAPEMTTLCPSAVEAISPSIIDVSPWIAIGPLTLSPCVPIWTLRPVTVANPDPSVALVNDVPKVTFTRLMF